MTERKTALITGASAGLGAEFARQLAAWNYNLVLVARRREKLDAVAASLADYQVDITVIPADLADPAAPEALAKTLDERDIQVDYLVNNAGASGPDLLDGTPWDAERQYLELMMISVAHMCHRFIPAMRARGWGRVINVASVAGRIASNDANYGPSKAYVIALSEGLSCSLRGTGVNVCALCPGFTHTDFHAVAGLLDMKAQLPGFVWYDADVVVAEGLKAVERGKPIMVSGRLYRFIDPLLQSVWTRPLLRAIR